MKCHSIWCVCFFGGVGIVIVFNDDEHEIERYTYRQKHEVRQLSDQTLSAPWSMTEKRTKQEQKLRRLAQHLAMLEKFEAKNNDVYDVWEKISWKDAVPVIA